MHVLLADPTTVAAGLAARDLVAAGHIVHRCHDQRDSGLACSALRGRACPLETAPVDVAVTVRVEEGVRQLPGDDGSFCAVRRRVPLVVAGRPGTHPFLRFPHRRVAPDETLAEAVAAATFLEEHTEVASAELRRVVADDARAEVTRHAGGLRVLIENAGQDRTRAAVRVAAVLRALDPDAASIDVVAR